MRKPRDHVARCGRRFRKGAATDWEWLRITIAKVRRFGKKLATAFFRSNRRIDQTVARKRLRTVNLKN